MNLIMFGGPAAWDGAWYSRHHLTAGLARHHQVTLVGEAGDLRSALRDPLRLMKGARITKDSRGVLRYEHAGCLPDLYRHEPLRRLLYTLRGRSLQRAVRQRNPSPPIYYVWHPAHQPAVEALTDGPLVYHCYDRYDRYATVDENLLEMETRLARRAALCVAASVELGEHLTRLGARNVMVLRHGVDNELFHPGSSVNPELDRIPRPRLGLVASLTDAVDVATLLHVATERLDWSLVVVGGVHFSTPEKQAEFDALSRLPNVHLIGFRPRTEMPGWINGFDVAIACYDLTTWAPYIQPLKIYEYLGCGVPVVTSEISATRELGPLVRCAATRESWVPMIERVLGEDGASGAARRLEFARANSWNRRVAELEQALKRISLETAPEPLPQLLTADSRSRTAPR